MPVFIRRATPKAYISLGIAPPQCWAEPPPSPNDGRGKWGKADHWGKVNPPTLIHLPELALSFRDSHSLRVTLLHVLNVMTRRYD